METSKKDFREELNTEAELKMFDDPEFNQEARKVREETHQEADNLSKEVQNFPDKLNIKIKKGDTLWKMVQENVYQYYPKLTESDKGKTLTDQVIDEIIRQNSIEDVTSIKEGTKITINMAEITKIVQSYLDAKNGNKEIPEKLEIEIKKKDTLGKIIQNNIYKYYPNLTEQDKGRKLTNQISEKIMEQNGILDANDIKEGKKIIIKMNNVTQIIQNYLDSKNGNKEIPEKLEIEIKKKDTLGKIVQNEIYKYYPDLIEENKGWGLTKQIIDKIMEQNSISDANNIKEGDKIIIKMKDITEIIQDYLDNENGGNNDQGNNDQGNNDQGNNEQGNDNNEQIETIEGGYVTLSTLDEFRNSTDPLVRRLYKDGCYDAKNKKEIARKKFDSTKPGPRIYKAIESGKKVKVPRYIENKNSKIMKLEDIIKPKKIIDNKLAGKTFILDPGHGFNDTGAIGLATEGKNTEITVFECSIMMDVSYRVAQLLMAHGAKVEFTHYIPTRGISDLKDLPPCLPMNYDHDYRDKRRLQEGDKGAYIGQDASLARRKRISNSINGASMFISLHANSSVNPTTGEQIEKKKIDTYYYHDKDDSEKYAKHLMSKNGIGEFKNGERNEDYEQSWHKYGWSVINNSNKNPSVLIEMFNLSSSVQANQYRNPHIRQQKAEQLVNATINYYESK